MFSKYAAFKIQLLATLRRGFIRETDKYDKEGEFRAWIEEVKKQSLESLQKWEEKARGVGAGSVGGFVPRVSVYIITV